MYQVLHLLGWSQVRVLPEVPEVPDEEPEVVLVCSIACIDAALQRTMWVRML